MNVLQKIALWTGARMASIGGGVTFSLTDGAALSRYASDFGSSAIGGKIVNDESAMRVTTAFACVRTIAETVGSVTIGVYERQANGSNAEKVDHDLASILIDKSNVDMTGMVMREALTTNLAARGNGFAVVDRNVTGNLVSLYPVPTAQTRVKRDSSTNYEVQYQFLDRGRWETYPADKVWHVKGFGYNGLMGLSPIACAREALGLAMTGEEFNARLFANGMFPSMVLKSAVGLKKDQRDAAQEILEKLHAGMLNTGKPYMLPPGTEPVSGVFSPEDAQFLQLRQFQIAELCRVWRISPHKIGDLTRATNNNIEQLSLEFHQETMLPYYRRIEEAAQQLFRPQDRKRFFIRFNYESLLRADSQARAALYSILLQNGVFNRNEVRALENRNRVDGQGMDDYTVQSNMTLIQLLEQLSGGDQKKKARLVEFIERLRAEPSSAAPTLQ